LLFILLYLVLFAPPLKIFLPHPGICFLDAALDRFDIHEESIMLIAHYALCFAQNIEIEIEIHRSLGVT